MSCDWEGNRRSGVELAMRHRLKWFMHLRAQGLSKGDEHPTNTPHGVWYSLPIYLLVHGQVTIIFVVSVGLSVCLFVCLFVQSFSQPSLIRFQSN